MAAFNFKTRRGNTVPITVMVTVDDSPYDLTGASIFFTAKEDTAQTDDEALISLDTDDGITLVNAAGGHAKILIPASVTYNLPTDVPLYCDVQIKTSDDEIYTVATGKITFLEDITRRTT